MVVDAALFKARLPHEVAHRGSEVALSVEHWRRTFDQRPPRPLALPHRCSLRPAHYRASTTARRHRETHTGLSSSSRICTSQTWFVLPTLTGLPTAVRVPSLLGLRWLALISVPKAVLPSGQLSQAPTVATVSARTTLAPPCKKPIGWTCRSSTGIVITTLSGSVSAYSMPRSFTKLSFSARESRSISSAISPPVSRFVGSYPPTRLLGRVYKPTGRQYCIERSVGMQPEEARMSIERG